MKILFYVEPLTERENPTWKKYWLNFVSQMIEVLRRDNSAVQFFCITGDGLENEAKNRLSYCSVSCINQVEMVPRFGPSSLEVASHWYGGGTKLTRNRMASLVRSRLAGVRPDICITFSPAPFLKEAFGNIPVLHFEYGIVSRPPFPETFYLDPLGMFKHGFPILNKSELKNYRPTIKEVSLVKEIRDSYLKFISETNPFKEFLGQAPLTFDRKILVALQFSQFYAYDTHATFPDQYELLIQTLNSVSETTGVFVVEHPQYPIFSDETLSYLRNRYKNFLWIPEFRSVPSASQYMMEFVDAVVTVSSSVGLQTLLWKKPLIVAGSSHLDLIADANSLANIEALSMNEWTNHKESILAWYLTRYSIPREIFFDKGVLSKRLHHSINIAKNRDYSNYYNETFADIKNIANAYKFSLNTAAKTHMDQLHDAQNTAREEQIQNLTRSLAERDAQVAVCEEQIQNLTRSLAERDAQVAVCEEQIQNLTRSLAERDAQNTAREEQIQNLTRSLAERDAQNTAREEQIQNLTRSLAERDAQNTAREEQIQNLTRSLAERDAQNTAREEQIQNLTRSLAERDAQNTAREEQIQNLTRSLAERDAQNTAREEQIQNLTRSLAERDAQVAVCEEQIQNLTRSLAERDAQNTAREELIQELSEKISKNESSEIRLRYSISELEKLSENLILEVNQGKSEIKRYQQINDQLLSDISLLKESTSWKLTSPIRFVKSRLILPIAGYFGNLEGRLLVRLRLILEFLIESFPNCGDYIYLSARFGYRITPISIEKKRRIVNSVFGGSSLLRHLSMRFQSRGKAGLNLPTLENLRCEPKVSGVKSRSILIIDHKLPTPDRASGSLRIFTLIKMLREEGFEVEFISDWDASKYHWVLDNVSENFQKYENLLVNIGVACHYGFESAKNILELRGEKFGTVILCFPEIMHKYAPIVRSYASTSTLIYDTVDLHGIRYAREAELKNNDPSLLERAEYYEKIETAGIKSADITIAITPDEVQQIKLRYNEARTVVIPNVHTFPQKIEGLQKRNGLVFIGHYLHTPNEDAVIYFANEIYPLIQKKYSEMQVQLLGSNMTESVKSLKSKTIHTIGYVEDAEQYFAAARIFIAPLRYGAGMKGKIGQAMSLGIPVVTTSIGAEGMGLIDGEHVLVADTPQDFASAVLRLHEDDALWHQLSNAGVNHIQKNFSEDAVRSKLASLFNN